MAANTSTSWASYLFELQGKAVEVFASDHPWLAELTGVGDPTRVGRFTRDMDTNRDVFSGSKVRHSITPYGLQAGGWVAETGTWNVPTALANDQAEITLTRFVQPLSLTVDVERDSLNNSNAKAVAMLVKQARMATARNENWGFLGNGDALLASSTSANSDTDGLTMTVGTGANFDVLLPGTIVDVLVKAGGTDPGQGKRRLIASVSESAGTVTFSTTAQASDGGSGNITLSTNDLGIYMTGSYGNAPQGLQQVAAVSGTFEAIDKAANAFWQGTDGRAGDTDTLPLADSMLKKGVRRGRRWGVGTWDFGIGDPAAIDLYIDSKMSLVRYEAQESTIKSGFRGIVFDGADKPFPLIKEPAHKKASLEFIRKESFQLYGDSVGPAFLQDDGSMWRRFSRALEKEADYLDRVQLGVSSCNDTVFFNNLDVAD